MDEKKSRVDEFLDEQARKAKQIREFFAELNSIMRELEKALKAQQAKDASAGPSV